MTTSLPFKRSSALPGLFAQGYTLPANWYTDPALFAHEKRQIFHRSWQYVGLVEQVKQPGDFLTCTLGDVPLLVTRAEDGTLHAFINVCRHRGCELIWQACGHRKALQCSYHAWTYRLNGTLASAPGMKQEPGFDASRFALQRAQLQTWGPFLFVNPDLQAPPLESFLGELPGLLAATGLNLAEFKWRVRRRFEVNANWKVVVDNYLECYHCPGVHPGLCSIMDTRHLTVREYEYFSMWEDPREKAEVPDLYETGGKGKDGFAAYLWPNFTLNVYAGLGNLSLSLFMPLQVDKTLVLFDYCFLEEVSGEEGENVASFLDQVQHEDAPLCEAVQRGLSSGFFEQGKLILHRENGLRHFQRLVYRALMDE